MVHSKLIWPWAPVARLGLALGETDGLSDLLTLADGEADPEGESDGEADLLTLAEGLALADGESETLSLELGEAEADGLPLTDAEGLPLTEADGEALAPGDALADGLELALGLVEIDSLGLGLTDGETDGLTLALGLILALSAAAVMIWMPRRASPATFSAAPLPAVSAPTTAPADSSPWNT